jgi:hypothetical protein
MKKSKKQHQSSAISGNGRGSFKQALTVAAAVASLGPCLGVNVHNLFAADRQDYTQFAQDANSADEQSALQHKGRVTEADQIKGEHIKADFLKQQSAGADQLKGESTKADFLKGQRTGADQIKFDGTEARQIKFFREGDTLLLKNGDSLVMAHGKAFLRTKGGKQTPAQDGTYELRDGSKLDLESGRIVKR